MGEAGLSVVDLLAAITSCKETLTTKIDFLSADISLKRHDMEKHHSHLSVVETCISQLKDTELHVLQCQVKVLLEKLIDTDNRLHCNNLRVLGIPERVGGSKPAEFAVSFLTNLLSLQDLPPTFVVGWRTMFLPHLLSWEPCCAHFLLSSSSTEIKISS